MPTAYTGNLKNVKQIQNAEASEIAAIPADQFESFISGNNARYLKIDAIAVITTEQIAAISNFPGFVKKFTTRLRYLSDATVGAITPEQIKAIPSNGSVLTTNQFNLFVGYLKDKFKHLSADVANYIKDNNLEAKVTIANASFIRELSDITGVNIKLTATHIAGMRKAATTIIPSKEEEEEEERVFESRVPTEDVNTDIASDIATGRSTETSPTITTLTPRISEDGETTTEPAKNPEPEPTKAETEPAQALEPETPKTKTKPAQTPKPKTPKTKTEPAQTPKPKTPKTKTEPAQALKPETPKTTKSRAQENTPARTSPAKHQNTQQPIKQKTRSPIGNALRFIAGGFGVVPTILTGIGRFLGYVHNNMGVKHLPAVGYLSSLASTAALKTSNLVDGINLYSKENQNLINNISYEQKQAQNVSGAKSGFGKLLAGLNKITSSIIGLPLQIPRMALKAVAAPFSFFGGKIAQSTDNALLGKKYGVGGMLGFVGSSVSQIGNIFDSQYGNNKLNTARKDRSKVSGSETPRESPSNPSAERLQSVHRHH